MRFCGITHGMQHSLPCRCQKCLTLVSCPMGIIPRDVHPSLGGEVLHRHPNVLVRVLHHREKPLEDTKGSSLGPVGWEDVVLPLFREITCTGPRRGCGGSVPALPHAPPRCAAALRPSAGRAAAPAPSTWPGSRPSLRT